MPGINELRAFQCKYIAGNETTNHQFCCRPTESEDIQEPYCPEHKAICHTGNGKDPMALEAMMYLIDRSQHKINFKPDRTLSSFEELQLEAKRRERKPLLAEAPPPSPGFTVGVRKMISKRPFSVRGTR